MGAMSNEAAVGFWSYAHEDDALDGGNILRLSRLIMEEYNLLSGEPLKLFVDRNDVGWGEEWRKRVNASLAETIFFIPIITPRYFTRPECRRELLEFSAKATMLGTEELILPIVYIEMPDMSAENPDEAVALVARMQYVDWHINRLLEPSSREYRVATNALARRLIDVSRKVAEIQFMHELKSDPEDDSVDGITDIVARIETLLPDWLDAVMAEKSVMAQVGAVWKTYLAQMRKLQKRKAPSSALLSTQIRMAREVLPMAERGLKDSQIYLARSVELDPLISALARLVTEHPDSFPLAAPIRDAIDEAMDEIRIVDRQGQGPPGTIAINLRNMNHLGRIFQQCANAFFTRARYVKEGNDIVRRWNEELIDHNSRQLEQSFPEVVIGTGEVDAEQSDQ